MQDWPALVVALSIKALENPNKKGKMSNSVRNDFFPPTEATLYQKILRVVVNLNLLTKVSLCIRDKCYLQYSHVV